VFQSSAHRKPLDWRSCRKNWHGARADANSCTDSTTSMSAAGIVWHRSLCSWRGSHVVERARAESGGDECEDLDPADCTDADI